jgi:transposase InsO family protein
MCEALRVKQCQYYQWIRQRANREKRKIRGMRLVEVIRRIFHENREVYGCRKMKIALQAEGICISEWKIRRIMRENGLYPQTKKKWKPYKKAKSEGFYSENKVKRHFLPNRFNAIWAGDITYIPTNLGWVYLAAVLDMKNKEVIGYEVSRNIDSELCKRALSNALALRGKHEGLIFHSDRGSQYSSRAYKRMLQENGIEGSMSVPGCPYDNSCVESFFATLKKELIFRRQYATIEEVKTDLYRYIELFYNRKRLHSTLGYMSPVAYRLAFMQ